MGFISFLTQAAGTLVLGGAILGGVTYWTKVKPLIDQNKKFETENDYFRFSFEPNDNG